MARRSVMPSPAAFEVGRPCRWDRVTAVVRALGTTMPDDEHAYAALARITTGLTAPLRQLDELASYAAAAIDGDDHARRALRSTMCGLLERQPRARGLVERLHEGSAGGCCRDCRRQEDEDVSSDFSVLDEEGLVGIALVVAQTFASDDPELRGDVVDALTGLIAGASVVSGLGEVLQRDGAPGLATHFNQLAANGFLAFAGQLPMRTLSGGLPPGEIPGLPPGGIPGLPGGKPKPPRDDDFNPIIEGLLGHIKKRKFWDPEIHDHAWRWWEDFEYIDRDEIDRVRCTITILRLLAQRAAIPPPPRPTPAVWSSGIASLEAGTCAGDQLVIRGAGFGNPQPANVVLLLPFADGCHPVAVPAGAWTDTAITVTLPAGVVTGPVGFGDAAYIAAYDAWAAQQNALADVIRTYKCAKNRVIPFVPGFRECPPLTPLNRLRAGDATIGSFTANGGTTVVVEPGEAITLAWTVTNAEHVRIDRTSGVGPAFAGSTALVDPGKTSYAFGPSWHTSQQVFTYRLTATGPCRSDTRDVTIVASKQPRLRINGIEVTQSIQTPTHTVRLVESKPTVVRVTVGHGLGGWGANVVPGVTGRIRVRRIGVGTSPWFDPANGSNPMAATPGASITVPASPQRNNTNDTLNFLIPPAWCAGTVYFEVEVRVTGFGAAVAFAGFNSTASATTANFSFLRRNTLELRYVRVNWGGSTPSDQVCRDTLRTAVPLLPTPTANISALAGVGVQNSGGTGDDERDDLLDDFDDLHNCSWWEALWEWLGEDCPDDDGAYWVLIPGMFYRGRAYDIPSNVCFTPPNNGPYAAHELSHCLNQEHVGVMCSNGQTATGGDPPGDWPNNAQLTDVPFDVTRNVALTLAAPGVFDVMTYCGTPNNTWPMPVRWDRLWNEIGG